MGSHVAVSVGKEELVEKVARQRPFLANLTLFLVSHTPVSNGSLGLQIKLVDVQCVIHLARILRAQATRSQVIVRSVVSRRERGVFQSLQFQQEHRTPSSGERCLGE